MDDQENVLPERGPEAGRDGSGEHGAQPAAREVLSRPAPPARPEYLQAAFPRERETPRRRGFFLSLVALFVGSPLAVGFSTLAMTHLVWLLGAVRFMFPNILAEPPTRFKVGSPEDLSAGQVETRYTSRYGAWIVRHEYDGQAQIFALKAVCTHLGCIPIWLEGEQKFKCPCHGSGFYKDGINFEGPAPRPLERFAIHVADDGQLEVDKSRAFQQELGQWRDPDSFVPI